MKLIVVILSLAFAFSSFAGEIPFRQLRVRIFTSPSWCGNCKHLEKHLKKTNQEKFLRINHNGEFRAVILEYVDPDKVSPKQAAELGYSGEGIPEFVVVHNRTNVVARDSGYRAGTDFSRGILSLIESINF